MSPADIPVQAVWHAHAGTNLIDAEETVNSIVADAPDLAAASSSGHDRAGAASLVPALQARGVQVLCAAPAFLLVLHVSMPVACALHRLGGERD
jgi:hypothetical protein